MTSEAIETVLADFRAWLTEVAEAEPTPAAADTAPIDLHTLLGQFIALRHDVNLQTKATRAQQELNNEMLQQLRQALASLEQSQAADQEVREENQDAALRPLLKTLVDVHDALALAAREVDRAGVSVAAALDEFVLTRDERARRPKKRSVWSRLFGSDSDEGNAHDGGALAATQARSLIASILTGYTMSVQRVERALEQLGLEPIDCLGQGFDPELMEVVAAVERNGHSPGVVVEVVRQGYLWHGRVFRYAQVSVAKQEQAQG